MIEWPYKYTWNRAGRKGQRCRVLIRTRAMNTCMLEFEDGGWLITSRNALRRAQPTTRSAGDTPPGSIVG